MARRLRWTPPETFNPANHSEVYVAKESKFGTFGGVYTPSLLTILGVIMYLRLPWVVGHAGLVGVFGIILIAHVISIATGLSISSIATDKNVGAGGPYYIVSRSLGLPIGGALGLALFIGLCFSTSLYVIGFSESMLSTLDIEATPTTIRIAGSIVLVVITAVTIISTAFAIKTQYVVLALIGISLFAIFLGDPSAAKVPAPTGEEGPTPEFLFGIFFPAVTGFTAGVNMSGDLKDPKKAIPTGTMAAIFTGLAVYLGLAYYLSSQVPQGALTGDPNLLETIAVNRWPVILGIWGATFSSGLGSIMGAPRILQALSADRITFSIFARGTGPTKEPRNALVLAFLIAWAGVLIAELNAIARIVSMVFLSMYAFLNICCAIEAKVSPDFRPTFRVPASVSVLGAFTCLFIMIKLDPAAMLGASALMVGLFVYLQRKQLKLDSGDAWGGIWSSVIRTGLYRVTGGEAAQQRNWRPNILSFRHAGEGGEEYTGFAESLITGNGILTDFTLKGRESKKEKGSSEKEAAREKKGSPKKNDKPKKLKDKKEKGERTVGVFSRDLKIEEQLFPEIQTVCQHYGFAGLEPNTLLLPFSLSDDDPEGFAETVDQAAEQNFNVLSYHHRGVDHLSGRIDIWWRVDSGNIAFALALLKFLTRDTEWEGAPLRFLLLSVDSANNDNLRSTMRRLLRESRVEATIKIVNDSFKDRGFADRVRNLSDDAGLCILGLPNENGELEGEYFEEFQSITAEVDRVLFIRGSSAFAEVLPTGRAAAISELPPLSAGGEELEQLPELKVSDVADVRTAATTYSESYQRLVGRLNDRCVKKVYGRHIELIRALRRAAERHLTLEKSGKLNNPRKLRNAFNRQQSNFLLECQSHLEEFASEDLPDLRSILEGGIDAFLHDEDVVCAPDHDLVITRKKADMKADEDDSAYIRRFKRRRRFGSFFKRRDPQYRIPVFQLQRFYFQNAVETLLAPTTQAIVAESHLMMVQIGKLLNSTRATLPDDDEEQDPAELLSRQRRQLEEHFDDMDARGKLLISRRGWSLIVDALGITQRYADDIDRLDCLPLLRSERVPLALMETEDLEQVAETWQSHQKHLTERARLALSLSAVQHRLTAIVTREREAIEIGLKNGALQESERVIQALEKLLVSLKEQTTSLSEQNLHVDLKTHFDPQPVLDSLVRECGGTADDLPAALETLTDESIQALEEGRTDQTEEVEIPVRRLMQFLTETELIGGLEEALKDIPREEQRTLGIAQDVVRLVNFQLSELDATDDINREEFEAQMRPVVENGIERLKVERERLEQRSPEILALVDQKLHHVVDGTNAYELSNASDRLDQHIRVYHGKLAVSGARGVLTRSVDRVRNSAVNLLYRRSEGVLLAQERKGTLRNRERAVDRIAGMVRSEIPRESVLEELPFYYRQLFFGQSGINDTFWVGRKKQLAKAKRALSEFEGDNSGCLLVVGDRLSGKSALLQKLGTDVYDRRKVFRIHPPAGGSIDPRAFERALRKASGETVSAADAGVESAIASLPSGSVLVFDDLNLWWERSEQGLQILEIISKAMATQGGRLFFVLSIETQAFRLINRLIPLSDSALAILQCGPLPAESLKSIVTLRHSSTGLKFKMGKKMEDQLGDIALARLFSQHFDHSGGSVGATLRAWVGAIERVRGDTLEVSAPTRHDWEALDTLKPSWVALLLQLALHKQMSVDRLRRVSGLPLGALREDLDALTRMGLIYESQRRILEIEPAIVCALQERFIKRGIFA